MGQDVFPTTEQQVSRNKKLLNRRDLLKRGEDISPLRDSLIFGQAFADGGGAADPRKAVAALADSAEICAAW